MIQISAQRVLVDFPIYTNHSRSLKQAVLNVSTGGRIARTAARKTVVRALEDVSFAVNNGERVGLMGHNGSGKTTLLRCLAGVYSPSQGSLEVKGRIASLLDIGLGMDQDATGYENIKLRGLMMGLRPREIDRLVPEVEEFSELGNFLTMPVRNYSSGMTLRLAFAVSTAVRADVVLMDEWLAVGDEGFRQKAAQRLKNLIDNSSALIIASHSRDLIAQTCTRCLTLEHGRLVKDESLLPALVSMEGLPA